jgi:hypothetical protein
MDPYWEPGRGLDGDAEDLSPVTLVVLWVLAAVVAVLTGWMTIVAFVGGRMPIVGWEVEGGLGTGLLWLLFVDPIVFGAMMAAGSAVAAVVEWVVEQVRGR